MRVPRNKNWRVLPAAYFKVVSSFRTVRRRLWGWRLAIALIAAQVLGNLVNLFRGRILEGAVGIAIAAALLFYLLSPPIRVLFRPNANQQIR